MVFSMLMTQEMRENMVNGINILHDFGHVTAVFPNEEGKIEDSMEGDHVVLEGEEELFRKWLMPYDAVAVGKGSPMMQEFQIMHIK